MEFESFFEQLRESNPLVQFFGVMVVAMIPFLEGYFAVPLGIAVGFPALLTIGAAIVGNWVSVMAVILASDRFRQWMQGRSKSQRTQEKENKRWQKGQKLFHKYGVPGYPSSGRC